jgi:hypothetical protein
MAGIAFKNQTPQYIKQSERLHRLGLDDTTQGHARSGSRLPAIDQKHPLVTEDQTITRASSILENRNSNIIQEDKERISETQEDGSIRNQGGESRLQGSQDSLVDLLGE